MPRYTLIQRLLHWTIAILVLGALSVGMIFGTLEYDGTVKAFGQDMTNLLYKYHKTLGVLILGLMVVRVIVKLVWGRPEYADPLTPFQRAASGAVHGLLYVSLLAMPMLGWAATAASGYPVAFFDWTLPPLIGKDKALGEILYQWHGYVGFLIIGLVAVHIGAALMHWRVLRDRVMTRMSLF